MLAALAISCTQTAPAIESPAPSREPGVLEVTVLLDLSGDRRPGGNAQRDAIQLWLDQRQSRPAASSSAGGPPLRVRTRTVDVAGSDAKVLIELRRAVEEQHADAIIVGTPITPQLATFAAAADLAQVPILLTLPASDALASGWIFALAPSVEQLARAAIDDVAARGIARANVQLVPESAAAQTESAALSLEAARRQLAPMTVVRVERPEPQPSASQLLATASAFHVLGAPRDVAALTRSASAPPFYLSYLTDPLELGAFRDVPTAQWLGSRRVVASTAPGRPGPSAPFVQSFGERHGPPSTHAATAYDAIALLELAALLEGTADPTAGVAVPSGGAPGPSGGTISPARLRDRLERTTFAGIATTYAFSTSSHAGPALDDLAYLRWTGSAVATVSRAGVAPVTPR